MLFTYCSNPIFVLKLQLSDVQFSGSKSKLEPLSVSISLKEVSGYIRVFPLFLHYIYYPNNNHVLLHCCIGFL